ncbi:MAG: hypothetical protein HKN23_15465 [Verrucomicrobiales bacterium]|nr:hypothetical protein [Verrucomicrobiales bacterium]
MNSHQQFYARDSESLIDPPPTRLYPLIRWCFIIFLFSFVFDYRAPDIEFGAARTGGSIFQFAFLGIALAAGGLCTLLGWRFLFVRPGVYLVLLWWGYIAFMTVITIYQGNELARVVRLMVSPLLVGLAINVTLITACAGMRPSVAVRWFLIVGVISVFWKLGFGVLGTGIPLSEVRMEILSPAIRFLFAWVACALLLRKKFTWWVFVILAVPMIPTVLSVTRSIAFPIFFSGVAAVFCLMLGISWRMYDLRQPVRKLGVIGATAAAGIGCVVVMAMVQPRVIERWTERLFDNSGAGSATTEDLSSLMRKAEAVSMLEIMDKDPASYLYGKGIGAGYYWSEDYFPELFLVYPENRHQFAETIYTAGHSIWTYTLFSSGIIGILITLGAFFYCMWLSLHSGYLNSKTVMGRRATDAYLIFLPFIAMLATLSESITRNPFDERLTGVLFGVMVALPQFFYNRAFYLTHRETLASTAPQLILEEEDMDAATWEGSFPNPTTR